ncbi:hypothetical protein [Methylobacterium haplocladii]|uniref:Response regulatory domain-containing protein n=1 Tax=Methylobacterium haplocladii TaxID=1176176 RepID=A0A512IKF8_9HYPH|nr:hypothetical protein [Methylobacterium haplocladii]GEO98132.1 hypothetical protein MHA02_05200 [Methylobacterium haplocladii]GJD83622.1 hypothetical protein HPGCJGGD_1492 [Methylobacterium haplocladii]GLS60349.1 hypothetical protein GCM10007887_30280 [Methylobacterium haplocladii]
MSTSAPAPDLALVLVASTDQRDRACARLSRDGYDVLSFADCDHAAAWLEEETPAVALIGKGLKLSCSSVLDILSNRDVRLI